MNVWQIKYSGLFKRKTDSKAYFLKKFDWMGKERLTVVYTEVIFSFDVMFVKHRDGIPILATLKTFNLWILNWFTSSTIQGSKRSRVVSIKVEHAFACK